jgi:hypothetical protein
MQPRQIKNVLLVGRTNVFRNSTALSKNVDVPLCRRADEVNDWDTILIQTACRGQQRIVEALFRFASASSDGVSTGIYS